jgi:phage baseplate assembly protein W
MTVQVYTPRTKKPVLYSDVRKDLALSPISSDIAVLKDEDSVKESIKNLILTDPGERLMQPYIGGGIRALLFENITPGLIKIIEDRVTTCIETYEPRCELIDVTVSSNIDDNTIGILIRFFVQSQQQPITLNVILERIR